MAASVQQLYQRHAVWMCAVLVLFLAIQLVIFGYFQIRHEEKRYLNQQAVMTAGQIVMGANGTGARYRDVLAQTIVNQHLVLSCVRDRQGHILSALSGLSADEFGLKENAAIEHCQQFSELQSAQGMLIARAPVMDPRLPQPLAEVVLVARIPSVIEQFGPRMWIFLLTVVGLAALLLWQKEQLRRLLIRPIHQIATTAQRVTLYKDYSLRVTPGALVTVPNEIEMLIESFNTMLKEVEDRDSRLTRKTMELEKSKQQADAANSAKSQFLAHVSHELRTPLNAIIGFSTMLSTQRYGAMGNEKYVEYAKDIHESGKHLLDVINDILDLSRAEAGKLSVKFEYLAIAKLIEKAVAIVASQAQEAKVDLYTDVPEKLPKIVADRVRLVQILLHLLTNAIKYTLAGGKVTVRVRAEAGRSNVHFFTIEVEDTGIGMTDEQIRNAFESFNQANAGLNRQFEGAGLGLPLSKRLVELHHGKIKIDSMKGHGTTVSVRLTSDPGLLD